MLAQLDGAASSSRRRVGAGCRPRGRPGAGIVFLMQAESLSCAPSAAPLVLNRTHYSTLSRYLCIGCTQIHVLFCQVLSSLPSPQCHPPVTSPCVSSSIKSGP